MENRSDKRVRAQKVFAAISHAHALKGQVSDIETISRMSEVAGTLGNDSRLILMLLIAEGEKSVDTLSELSGLPVASTSQHLQVLKKANMVATRRDGKHVLYRLQNGPTRELIDALERFAVFRSLKLTSGDYSDERSLTAKELEKKLSSSAAVLVDVRSRDEFEKGHIAGAINIPFDDIKAGKARLPADQEVVVYCRGPYCLLSVNAVELLRSQGVEAQRLKTGYADWPGNRSGKSDRAQRSRQVD